MIEAVKGVEPSTGYPPILALSEIEAEMRKQRVKRHQNRLHLLRRRLLLRHLDARPPHPQSRARARPRQRHLHLRQRQVRLGLRQRRRPPAQAPQAHPTPTANTFVEIEWDEALDIVADKFTKIKKEHGPDALAFVASSKCTNEESYLMQKLARAVIGTNNIDNCSRYCQTPASKGLSRTVGYGGDSGSISDIEIADLVIIIGSNTAESHPVLATRIKRSHKHRGQRLIVADLRKHEMAERADLFLRPNPSTDEVWLCAVTKHLIDTGRHNAGLHRQVGQQVVDEYRASLEPYTLEYAEKITGIPVATLKHIADEIASAERVCILWAMGVTQHCGGSDTSTAICNLLLATGNFKRPGTGAYPLRGHNNVQGASDFGSMPDVFSGYQKVDNAEIRAKFEAAWGVTLPTTKGLDNREMIEAIHAGKLKSLYINGEDTITSDANANDVAEAFGKLDFLLVQDIFFSETCRYADLVLPASPSLEKDGTFVTTERRIQRLYKAFEPLGDSKPDWEIYPAHRAKARRRRRLGLHASVRRHGGGRQASRQLFAGVTYERLEGYKTLQWPVAKDGTDEPLLYAGETTSPSPTAKPASIRSSTSLPAKSRTQTYDLHLNNGRLLEHFEQGNLSYRVPGHQGDHARSLRRGLARARRRTRPRLRPLRPARKPVRPRPRQGPRHRSRLRQADVHAHELRSPSPSTS